MTPPNIRIGQGFDVHAFAPHREMWLCGVRIPCDFGLLGHSDADAPLHALADAILGAIGEGDIGTHFPNTDERWKGCSSDVFVREALRLASQRGYAVANADLTILAEKPKIAPHLESMTVQIALLLECDKTQVAVKATTMERMGFVGREEGLCALAVVLLYGR